MKKSKKIRLSKKKSWSIYLKTLGKQTKNTGTYIATKSNGLYSGLFGIKTISTGRINTKQIESMTRFISKKIRKKTGYTVKNITLNKTLTKKPTGIRMGKGKGDIKDIISYVSKGSNLFEINRYKKLTYNISFLQKACKRSPIDSKIIFNYKTQANIFNPSIQYCN